LLQTTDEKEKADDEDDNDDEPIETGCTLFVKNLNFNTTEDALKQVSYAFFFLPLFYQIYWILSLTLSDII